MRLASSLCVIGLVAACDSPGTSGTGETDAAGTGLIDAAVGGAVDAPGGGLPAFQRCVGRPFTPPPAAGWETIGGQIAAAAGAPGHYAVDEVAPPASSPHIVARFVYGVIRKDLQDEPVAVFIDDCTEWNSLGSHVTDDTGAVDVPVTLPLGPGVYEATFAVTGDASTTHGYLWLLPADTHIAVTDIDGTLTTSDTELFQQILDGSYVPEAYPGAVALTDAHTAKGHIVLYMTGRPYWLTNKTREWLDALSFAIGPVHLAPSNFDILPTDASVGEYKRAYLEALIAKGYTLDLAYGNATTDIYAYTGAGVVADRQWIIGTNAGAQGTHAVMDTWMPRVGEIQQLAPVAQPFTY